MRLTNPEREQKSQATPEYCDADRDHELAEESIRIKAANERQDFHKGNVQATSPSTGITREPAFPARSPSSRARLQACA